MFARALILFLLALIGFIVLISAVHYATMPANAHGWYSGYGTIELYPSADGMAPRNCCDTRDCREYTDVEEVTGGVLFKALGYVAPWSRIRPSPDGKWHACKMPYDPEPRCLFGPMPSY